MDDLDRRLIDLFAQDPRIGVLEASRRLGYPVQAFLTLEIRQDTADHGGHETVGRHLAAIPEVLEAHTITGAGDMWARVVARSNTDLQRVIDLVLKEPAIVRSSTVIALATQVPYRVLPLAREAAR